MAWKAVLMLVLLPLACTNESQTVYVAPPVGEREADRASILAALDEVQQGGTLQFAPGAYVIGEGIRVAVPRITLQGHAEGTVLRGCDAADFPDAREVGVENAVVPCNGLALVAGHQTVRGLTFEYAWHALWVGCCLPPELAGRELTETESPHVGGHLVEDNTFRNVVNGFRVIGDSPEPVVVRNNVFTNVWHAGGVNGRTAHIVDNRVSVPDPGQVPLNGFPGLALFITPHDTRGDQAFNCAGNVIAGNRIEGHPEGIAVLILGAGASCHDNVIRANTIAVSRVRFSRAPWGVIGIRSDTDSTLVGVPIALVDLVAEMAEFFRLRVKTRGDEELIYDNVVEENAIVGAEGIGIEVLRASRNRIVSNSITGIAARDPFPGNTMYVAPEWREANGSGIWISRGSNDNEIVGNTFATVNGHTIVVEGDRNVVETASETDEVRNLGSANQVRRLAGGTR